MMNNIMPYLSAMVRQGASDLFIYPEANAGIKINGCLIAFGIKKFSCQEVREIIYGLLTDRQVLTFEKKRELNFAIEISNLGRFREKVFYQRSKLVMVIRYVKKIISKIEALELPDVILVGEVRTANVMRATLNMAITGHLCLSTLHAKNAVSGLDRIVNFFSGEERDQLLADLALNLKAIISQRLIPSLAGQLVPAKEIMLNTTYISELIQKGKFEQIIEAMHNGGTSGMISFDQALINLYDQGDITPEHAIDYADSKNNVALKIKLSINHNDEKNDVITDMKLENNLIKKESYSLISNRTYALKK